MSDKPTGIGAKMVLPVPTTRFERDLVIALEDIFREIDDAIKNLEARATSLEARVTALEP